MNHSALMVRFRTLYAGLAVRLAILGAIAVSGCDRPLESDLFADSATTSESPADAELRARIDKAIEAAFRDRHLNTRDHAAWQVVHGALAYGKPFLIYDDKQRLVPAIDYLFAGGRLTGWKLLAGTENLGGRPGLRAELEEGSGTGQGHPDQWLGYLSQVGIQPTEAIKVAGREYTVGDLIEQAKNDVVPGKECTWTLMALTTYFDDLDATWKAADGREWSLEELAEMEARAGNFAQSCGGTHRLYALAIALNRYIAENDYREDQGKLRDGDGDELPGGWKTVHDKVREYVNLSRAYQQADGSFSSEYYQRAAWSPDAGERIGKTGHVLEFLTVALTEEEFKQPWLTRAAVRLCNDLETVAGRPVECGQLYHAIHGLILYRERRFGKLDMQPWAKEMLDQQAKK